MPRDVNGNVSLPTNDSSPAAPRNVIRSSDFNELMGDISTMMQDSLSRSGKGGMTADLDMDGNDVLNAANLPTTARAINTGTGLTGGGDLSSDRTIALSAGSIASLAKADTALQPTDNRAVVWSDAKLSILDIADYANDHRLNVVVEQSVANDFASFNLNRSSGISGGTDALLNSALRIENSIYNSGAFNASTNPYGAGPGHDGKPYEWGLGIVVNNGRNYSSGGYKGQNGAAYFAAYKKVADAGGTWGINSFVFDWPGLNNPTELVQAGEFDVHADGTDSNNVRIGISSNIKSTISSDGSPSGYGEAWAAFVALPDPGKGGIASGAWYAKWKTGFYAAGPMDVAFDCADGSNPSATAPYSTPIGLRMNYEQKLSFSPSGNQSLRGVSSGNKLVWQADAGSGNTDVWAVDASGNSVFGAGTPTVVASHTWLRVFNSAGSSALQLGGGGGRVDGRMVASGNTLLELGTYSDHVVIFRHNSAERFRLTAPGNAVGMQFATTGTSYANDAAAAVGGVPVGGIYRNGSALQVRVT